jgi:hypothetical protein
MNCPTRDTEPRGLPGRNQNPSNLDADFVTNESLHTGENDRSRPKRSDELENASQDNIEPFLQDSKPSHLTGRGRSRSFILEEMLAGTSSSNGEWLF